jgi:hypothetical protein
MTTKSLLLSFYLLVSTIAGHADTTVTLAAVDPATKERRVDPKDDFVVEVRNNSDKKISIESLWDVHILFVDGKRYPVVRTAWWCMDSPDVQPGAVCRRSMHLNYYSGLSLGAGVHELQLELGSAFSNKIHITTTGPRRDYTQR